MQDIKTNIFGIPTGRGDRGISEEKEHGRECLSDNGAELKRTNLMDGDGNENALVVGVRDCVEGIDCDIYEGKVLEGDTEGGDVSTFVEIPMAGAERGRNIQITGFQAPMGKDETVRTSVHEGRAQEASKDGNGIRAAEVVIQAGWLNLLIYGGVREATLRTVMKVVMDHA